MSLTYIEAFKVTYEPHTHLRGHYLRSAKVVKLSLPTHVAKNMYKTYNDMANAIGSYAVTNDDDDDGNVAGSYRICEGYLYEIIPTKKDGSRPKTTYRIGIRKTPEPIGKHVYITHETYMDPSGTKYGEDVEINVKEWGLYISPTLPLDDLHKAKFERIDYTSSLRGIVCGTHLTHINFVITNIVITPKQVKISCEGLAYIPITVCRTRVAVPVCVRNGEVHIRARAIVMNRYSKTLWNPIHACFEGDVSKYKITTPYEHMTINE
jgi:hypothetical protein